jgi:spore maturation protein A
MSLVFVWNIFRKNIIIFQKGVVRMSKIWSGMIIIAIVLSIVQGNLQELISALMNSTQSAIETVLDMMGMLCMWSGFMKIAEESGIVKSVSKKITPIVKFIFPELPRDNEATGHIAMNMTANLLGLGNIATPMGLKAMEKLELYNDNKSRLSNSMMMFIILNTASIQLIPTSVIALRASYNSTNPADIVLPIILASFGSVVVGIILVKLSCRRKK